MSSTEKDAPSDSHDEGAIPITAAPNNEIQAAAGKGQAATDKYGNPLVEFDPVAVRKLRWKLDLYTIPTVALLYLFCFIDRANIGNARIAGLDKDLNLKGYDYNMVLSIFYISYILFEIPATVACKWMGPGWFLPITSLLFGVVSIATAFCHDRASICGVRFLLGIFEAGMLPGIAYYLSRWYQRAELTFRLSLYMVMAPLAGAFGGLLASAILTLDHFGSLHDWRMIFAIEGIVTIGLSLISFFTLTDRPETARWLTQEERDLCIARVKSERVGATEVIDKIDKTKLKRGMFNPVTFQIAIIFLFNNITVQGLAFFLPTIVSTIYPTYTTVEKQLHSVPPYVVGAFFTIAFPSVSWYLDRRQVLIALSAPMVMCGYIMFLASKVARVRYGATFLIASSAMVLGPMSNAHISANVVSDTARSSAIGMNVMFGNVGGLISTWSFISKDAPDYPIGNGLNLAASSMILIVATSAWFWMKWDNKRRDELSIEEELAGMPEEEIRDLDWKHPAFRWRT
ncbi:major facilitator superfamily transporter [Colletotrichum zoysiae]|uniref:Major facilitator superfamily transporter n=1 Tax=Colletotrichum zoysiae TaxID=1216348 RepID=A0AAD9M5G9_9PEZI|nr:major facilitator superfamily transporter [Colletotrichum zoysiae]